MSVQFHYHKVFIYVPIPCNEKKESKVLGHLLLITLNFWTVCNVINQTSRCNHDSVSTHLSHSQIIYIPTIDSIIPTIAYWWSFLLKESTLLYNFELTAYEESDQIGFSSFKLRTYVSAKKLDNVQINTYLFDGCC